MHFTEILQIKIVFIAVNRQKKHKTRASFSLVRVCLADSHQRCLLVEKKLGR